MPCGSVSGGNSAAGLRTACKTGIKTGNRTGVGETFEKILWQRHWH